MMISLKKSGPLRWKSWCEVTLRWLFGGAPQSTDFQRLRDYDASGWSALNRSRRSVHASWVFEIAGQKFSQATMSRH